LFKFINALRKKYDDKLTWGDTYKAMANEDEDWSDYEATLIDGLEDDDVDRS
jgi:hypothetical protein